MEMVGGARASLRVFNVIPNCLSSDIQTPYFSFVSTTDCSSVHMHAAPSYANIIILYYQSWMNYEIYIYPQVFYITDYNININAWSILIFNECKVASWYIFRCYYFLFILDTFECYLCNRTYNLRSGFYGHMLNYHALDENGQPVPVKKVVKRRKYIII